MAETQLTIRDSLLAIYAELPAGERQLADAVLAKANDLASFSATELAHEARVSKATATRLFRRLGCANFQDVRRRARNEAHLASPLYALAGVDAREPAVDALSRHMANDLQNLSQTFGSLNPEEISRAVKRLAGARHVRVVGFRAGHVLARYAHYLFAQVRGAVELTTAATDLADDLASLREKDVLLVIDFRRRVHVLDKAVAAAREAGADIVFVSGMHGPAISRAGDVVLSCHHGGALLFDSYAAPLSLIGFLASAVAQRLGPRCRARLERIEALHAALGDVAG